VFELRVAAFFTEEAPEGIVQVFERGLEGVNRRFLQEGRLGAIAPGREPFGHIDITGKFLALGIARLLLCERGVPDEAAAAGVAAQQRRLSRLGTKPVFEALSDDRVAHKPLTAKSTFGGRAILPPPKRGGLPRKFNQKSGNVRPMMSPSLIHPTIA